MMNRAPFVISIQSQVVFGHVGNSAAVFPMQAVGLEVAPIPTVLFSNTPHYPTLRGAPLPPDIFADLLLGANERGLAERADFILTGYIGSGEVAGMTADFISKAKAANPNLTYVCDPVLGDSQPGLYVPEHVAAIVRDCLLPMADIATPNPFELGWLTGHAIDSIAEVEAARRSLSISPTAQLIVTGCSLADTLQNHIESVLIGPRGTSRHPVLHIPSTLPGTGDLFAGLIVAGLGCGMDLPKAVDLAQEMTSVALAHANTLNAGEVTLDDSQFRHALLTLTQSRFDQHAGI